MMCPLAPVAAARAEGAWLEGRPEAIGAETEYAYDTACRVGEPTFAGWLACWRARAGLPVEPPDGLPERCRLQLAGEPELAAELFEAEGATYDAAIALVPSMDGALLRSALDRLHALGAKPAAALVSRRLRELGERQVPRGPRASTSENPAGLTNREARGSAAARRGSAQRGDRQASGPLAEDRRSPRLRDPAKTRRQVPRSGERCREPARPDPEDQRPITTLTARRPWLVSPFRRAASQAMKVRPD